MAGIATPRQPAPQQPKQKTSFGSVLGSLGTIGGAALGYGLAPATGGTSALLASTAAGAGLGSGIGGAVGGIADMKRSAPQIQATQTGVPTLESGAASRRAAQLSGLNPQQLDVVKEGFVEFNKLAQTDPQLVQMAGPAFADIIMNHSVYSTPQQGGRLPTPQRMA